MSDENKKSVFETIENFIEDLSHFLWVQVLTIYYLIFKRDVFYDHLKKKKKNISRPTTFLITSILIFSISASFNSLYFDIGIVKELHISSIGDLLKLVLPFSLLSFIFTKIYIHIAYKRPDPKINEITLYSISILFLFISFLMIVSELLAFAYIYINTWNPLSFGIISILSALFSYRIFKKANNYVDIHLSQKQSIIFIILITMIPISYNLSNVYFRKRFVYEPLSEELGGYTVNHFTGNLLAVEKNLKDSTSVFHGVLLNTSSREFLIPSQIIELDSSERKREGKLGTLFLNRKLEFEKSIIQIAPNGKVKFRIKLNGIVESPFENIYNTRKIRVFDVKIQDTVKYSFSFNEKWSRNTEQIIAHLIQLLQPPLHRYHLRLLKFVFFNNRVQEYFHHITIVF